MDECEVRIKVLKIAMKALPDTATIWEIIEYAEKIKYFVIDEWNSEEIKIEFEGRTKP